MKASMMADLSQARRSVSAPAVGNTDTGRHRMIERASCLQGNALLQLLGRNDLLPLDARETRFSDQGSLGVGGLACDDDAVCYGGL